MPVTETGPVCGTSAIRSPSVSAICTLNSSASSLALLLKFLQRMAGSGALGRVGGHAGHGDGPRVLDVGQQGAEHTDHLRADRLGELDDLVAEGPPEHGGLGAAEEDEITRGARHAGLVELELGTHDLAGVAL